jgi:hypothetical protein
MIQRETRTMQITRPRGFTITPTIKKEIVRIIDERIKDAHVTKEDFSELKGIVKELAAAQKRTELRVEELATAQKELAEAQKRTEIALEQLAKEQKKTQTDLGGLSKSGAYALENEAFRYLPKLLAEKHGINVKERFVRAHVGGKEINVFCQARRNGSDVYIVGEAKLRLDDARTKQEVLEELEEKVEAVISEYGEVKIVRMLITNFATKGFLNQAKERGVIVVQSFE